MGELVERLFALRAAGTTVRTEVVAGATTFATLSYIIFVQPAVLGAAGMDPGAVMVATCLAAALATLLVGLLANYPIAAAPAMGHNFFFAFTVVVGMRAGSASARVGARGAVGGAVRPRLIRVFSHHCCDDCVTNSAEHTVTL